LYRGASWAVDQGFGVAADLDAVEHGGRLIGADAAVLSPHARAIGEDQLGTLGAGHHFIEFGFVSDILDQAGAARLGLEPDQCIVWLHCGSRGLGQQVLNEYQRVMSRAAARHLIRLPDRQLCCAPIHSHEGREYLAAMAAAANFAFANRQVIAHRIAEVLRGSFDGCTVRTVYEQCHNTISLEVQLHEGVRKRLCVHRRACGRTADLLAGRAAGQPVLLAGHCTTANFAGIAAPGAAGVAYGTLPTGCGLRAPGQTAPPPAAETLLFAMQSGRTIAAPTNPVRDVEILSQTLAQTGAVQWAVRTRPLAVLRG
jgi:tRNA-splicing ligase RtcB (3'-phosphate/5'-hydroxy nucleic acid ligase)